VKLRAATRGSPLARWQAEHVADLLRRAVADIEVELVLVETLGDRARDRPIHELGGQGVFVKEVQAAVLAGDADFAVHSAKDLPSTAAPELTIAAVPERGDPRDCLVGLPLRDLPPGATVATGAVRRRAQLAHVRPDLEFIELRGNIQTRLAKVPAGGAIVMAVAALQRLELSDRIAEAFDPSVFVPQVAQGALALECREDDGATRALLTAIQHEPSRTAVDGERAFLGALGGGCDLPVGAYVTPAGDEWQCEGLLASLDGTTVLRHIELGADVEALGRRVASALLAQGGAGLLDRS
jgi:hydroxymethylbilane synthase